MSFFENIVHGDLPFHDVTATEKTFYAISRAENQ